MYNLNRNFSNIARPPAGSDFPTRTLCEIYDRIWAWNQQLYLEFDLCKQVSLRLAIYAQLKAERCSS